MFGMKIGQKRRQKRVIPVLALLLSFVSFDRALALGPPPDPDDTMTTAPFKALQSVYDAMHRAINSYMAGDKEGAIKSLEFAAEQGHAPAHWKLARMYAEGDGVPRDDAKAFRHFSLVCDGNAATAPNSPDARFVASSFISLGDYYLTGIPNTQIKANPARSREFYTYAATYFGDSEAQFKLAGLYLDGIGVKADTKQAIRWLNLSAEKGNRTAQAKLGALLFDGKAGDKQKARGLMWLTIASEGADPEQDQWIIAMHQDAMGKASDTDRLAADVFRSQFEASRKK